MSHSKAVYTKSGYQITRKREVWKPVPGVPNYEASSHGRIRSVFIRVLTPKYTYATLSDDPQYEIVAIGGRRILVHRMVAAAFLGPRPPDKIVHHRDHNKMNNRPKNLEYVTRSQNTLLAYADGRIGRTMKLTAFARKKVAEMYDSGEYRSRQLAELFHVSRSTILLCVRRAGITPHRMHKLSPKLYEEIRAKWVPYKYPVRRLAEDYGVSEGLIEAILGMRTFGRGKRLPSAREANVDA